MVCRILILAMLFSSCSSFRASILSGATSGALIGGISGAVLSPDRESTPANALLFSGLGALLGMGASYLIYKADPENQELPAMIMAPEKKFSGVEQSGDEGESIESPGVFGFDSELKNLKPEIKFVPTKKYEVPLEKLPPELKDKVKKQFVLEYEVQSQTLQYQNRTIEIGPFKAWEHVYEQ